MADYINAATKDIIVSLSGCVGFMDVLLTTPGWRREKQAKRNPKAAYNQTVKVLDIIEQGLDEEQKEAVLRTAKCSSIAMVPHLNPNAGKEFFVCPQEALDVLMADALSSCAFCDLEGKQVNKCAKRKALIRCGVVKNERGECPYRG